MSKGTEARSKEVNLFCVLLLKNNVAPGFQSEDLNVSQNLDYWYVMSYACL